MKCPQCGVRMPFDKEAFGNDFRCSQCGANLRVSEIYSRVLMIITMVISFGLLGIAHVLRMLASTLGLFWGMMATLALGFSLTFVFLFVEVRTIPRLIKPPLVDRQQERFAALNLTGR